MSEKKKTTAPKSAEEKEQKNRIPENVSGAEKLNGFAVSAHERLQNCPRCFH